MTNTCVNFTNTPKLPQAQTCSKNLPNTILLSSCWCRDCFKVDILIGSDKNTVFSEVMQKESKAISSRSIAPVTISSVYHATSTENKKMCFDIELMLSHRDPAEKEMIKKEDIEVINSFDPGVEQPSDAHILLNNDIIKNIFLKNEQEKMDGKINEKKNKSNLTATKDTSSTLHESTEDIVKELADGISLSEVN